MKVSVIYTSVLIQCISHNVLCNTDNIWDDSAMYKVLSKTDDKMKVVVESWSCGV